MTLTLATVATFVPAVYVAVRWVHGRPWRSVLTASARFRWGLFAAGFAITVGVMAVALGLDLAFGVSDIRWTFEPGRFLAFLLLQLFLPL